MPESLATRAGSGSHPAFKDTAIEEVARSSWRIRSSLALLVVACLLPGVFMSTYFILNSYHLQKTQAIQSAIAIARAAAASLDRDIASVASGLRVLATSNSLATDDIPAFYNQAVNALPYQNITNYVLIDEKGQQVMNTLKPWGTALPTCEASAQLQRVFEQDDPVVTDLFIGPVAGKPLLAMGVPVKREGKTVYSLNAGLFPQRVANVFQTLTIPKGWISAVMDSEGVIVARTKDMDRFVGKPAVPELARMVRQASEGVLETRSLEGIPVIVAFSRSHMSNWAVGVAIPKDKLTAELKGSLSTLLLLNVVVFAGALIVAWRLAVRRVVTPANQLLRRMQGIAVGEDTGPVDIRRMPQEFVMLEHGFAEMRDQLRERERELEAKLAAEAANRAKTVFLSRMSHELRTPLNAVLGFTQVLMLDPKEPLSQRQREMVQQIEASGKHLLEMISDVLDVSRIESGQMHIDLAACNVDNIIEECLHMLASDAEAAGLKLHVSLQHQACMVHADRTRLKQILLNLLSNAIKYNRPGGSIALTTGQEGNRLHFSVEDTGLGMTPEQMQHLFEPFNRLGRGRGIIPGAGIGLVICKQLLELMGSSLQVQTEAGKGSLFSFSLPCA